MMKRSISLLLIFLLVLTALAGCGPLGQKKEEVIRDVKPYRIMNKYDRSLLSAKRVEFAVYVEDSDVSLKTLQKYTEEIVEKYKDKYKGIMVCFYDIIEETSSYEYVPMAVGVWAPKGKFENALSYEDYEEKNWTVVVKKNKQAYKPTEEEKKLYAEYLKTTDYEKFKKEVEVPEGFENLENFIFAMKYRYEEVVKR